MKKTPLALAFGGCLAMAAGIGIGASVPQAIRTASLRIRISAKVASCAGRTGS